MTSERVDAQGVANIAKALQSVFKDKVTWHNVSPPLISYHILETLESHLRLKCLLAVFTYPTLSHYFLVFLHAVRKSAAFMSSC